VIKFTKIVSAQHLRCVWMQGELQIPADAELYWQRTKESILSDSNDELVRTGDFKVNGKLSRFITNQISPAHIMAMNNEDELLLFTQER